MKGKLKVTTTIRWNLKFAILRKFGTEVALAKLLGIGKAQLSHIITGRLPGWPYRQKIAKLLDCDEEFLFGGKNGNSNRHKAG